MNRIQFALATIAAIGVTHFVFADEPLLPPPGAVDEPAAPPATIPAPSLPPRSAPDPFGPARPPRYSPPPSRAPRSAIPGRPTSPPPSHPVPANPGDTKFSLTLKDGTRLIGKPVGLAKIPLGTTFGEAKIPLNVVKSLESQSGQSSVKIHLRNGDIVSGSVRAESMKFETAYGEITIPLAAVVKLNFGTAMEPRPTPASGSSRPVVRRGRSSGHSFPMPGIPGGGFAPPRADFPGAGPGGGVFVVPAAPDVAPAEDLPARR